MTIVFKLAGNELLIVNKIKAIVEFLQDFISKNMIL